MKPGATTRSDASITRLALSLILPISTTLSPITATSARSRGRLVPSTTVPFLINRSIPIGVSLDLVALTLTIRALLRRRVIRHHVGVHITPNRPHRTASPVRTHAPYPSDCSVAESFLRVRTSRRLVRHCPLESFADRSQTKGQ